MTTLIVTLPQHPADAAALYDYVLTPDGSTVGEQSCVPLALLPPVGERGGEVVAVVTARHLSWHQVQLPSGTLSSNVFQDSSTPRLRAVLEGLLEDRLLDEPSQLHFAIEPAPQVNAPLWVAVCDRAWLREALHALEQAGLSANRIVPEYAPGTPADTVYVTGEPEQVQMVFAAPGGVSVWPLSPASVALLNWPQDHHVVAEPAVAALAEQHFKRNVVLQQSAQRLLQAIASPWDLAQFDLVSSGRARNWKLLSAVLANFKSAPRWRPARVALLTLLVVNVAGLNAWAWREDALIDAKRMAVRDALTATFPSVRVVVDAPLQMAREVAALQQASGAPSGRDMETMMGVFGAAVPGNTAIDALEFSAGELRLKTQELAPEVMTELTFKLQTQGYVATIEGDRLLIKQGAIP